VLTANILAFIYCVKGTPEKTSDEDDLSKEDIFGISLGGNKSKDDAKDEESFQGENPIRESKERITNPTLKQASCVICTCHVRHNSNNAKRENTTCPIFCPKLPHFQFYFQNAVSTKFSRY